MCIRGLALASAQDAGQLQGEDLDLVHVGVELAGLRIAHGLAIQMCSTAIRLLRPSCQGVLVYDEVRAGGSRSGWSRSLRQRSLQHLLSAGLSLPALVSTNSIRGDRIHIRSAQGCR